MESGQAAFFVSKDTISGKKCGQIGTLDGKNWLRNNDHFSWSCVCGKCALLIKLEWKR